MATKLELTQYLGTRTVEWSPTGDKERDYYDFWQQFSHYLLARAIYEFGSGDPQQLLSWLKSAWRNSRRPPQPGFIEIETRLPFSGDRQYLAKLIPERFFAYNWHRPEKVNGLSVEVRSDDSRPARYGDRSTIAKFIAPDFRLYALQIMGHVGGGLFVGDAHEAEVLAISPMSIYFDGPKFDRIGFNPSLSVEQRRWLITEVNSGPTGDIWFPTEK